MNQKHKLGHFPIIGHFSKFSFVLVALFLLSCNNQNRKNGHIPQSWIEDRVNETKERLEENTAGQKIWEAMEAHGGLANWYSNGPLKFHFNYQPLDGNTPRNTIQISDNWSAKARQKIATDTSLQFGWDGEKAWALPDESSIPFDARFWALTPYYFVGIPFVLGDEGVILEEAGQDDLNGINYDLVKVTFQEGVGDAPDDYYVIYLHPQTRMVGAYRYVVSYPGYFPDGGHTPEKIMILNGAQMVEGIFFPEGYRTYMWEDDQPGKYVTEITLSDVEFVPKISEDSFEVPADAEVIREM